jgi:hypothetical protein
MQKTLIAKLISVHRVSLGIAWCCRYCCPTVARPGLEHRTGPVLAEGSLVQRTGSVRNGGIQHARFGLRGILLLGGWVHNVP